MKYHKGWTPDMSLEDTKNLAYWERNMLALRFAKHSNQDWERLSEASKKLINPSSGWYRHGEYDGWSRVISLLHGSITFHVPDDFDMGDLPEIMPDWDGHTTEEKWLSVMAVCGCDLPKKKQEKCKHEWRDKGYGFGILKCEKCGENSH